MKLIHFSGNQGFKLKKIGIDIPAHGAAHSARIARKMPLRKRT
jgi:hypothetical protein